MRPSLPPQILRIDLDDGTIESRSFPERWLEMFMGGKGLGARYLYEAIGPSVAPLDAENIVLFMVGPLTGYLPGGNRCAVVTKSPLTGLFLDSYVGGSLGPSLRDCFPDHAGIVIAGEREETCVIDCRGNAPTIEATPDLRDETNEVVDAAYPDALVVSVGPAGEHGVTFASIATHGGDHHAGRGGAGAVLGAKGLKALVLPETSSLPLPTQALARVRREREVSFSESPYGKSYRQSGTLETTEFADTVGILPAMGWQSNRFAGSTAIGLEAVRDAAIGRERKDDGFPGDYRMQIEDVETTLRGGTPIALGAGLGIDDVGQVAQLGATCDQLGLDIISAGGVLALAIHGATEGLINRSLSFGDSEAIEDLLMEIAFRSSPLGDLLADGVAKAGSGLGLEGAVPTVNAMAVPSFDPRGLPAMCLAYATSDRGACHRRAIPATVEVASPTWTATQIAQSVVAEQNRGAVLWSLIADDVLAPMFDDLGREWLRALGEDRSHRELLEIGERTWTMTRLFNVREDLDRTHEELPELFMTPSPDGGDRIDPNEFDRLLDRYYECRDWDAMGRPSARLLDRLDILELIDKETPIGGHPLHSDVGDSNG